MSECCGDTYLNARLYGAGNGIDDDALIAEALFASNPGSVVFFPAGTYNLNTTLNVPSVAGNRVHGAGRETTKFVTTGDYDGMKIDAGTTNQGAGFQDFRLDGTGARTGGYGINIEHFVSQCSVRNVHVLNQWRGIGLGPCDYGWFENSVAEYNYSHGVHVRGKDGNVGASLQWLLNNNLSQINTGDGFFYEGVLATGFSKASTGTITGCATFANSRYGFSAVGQAGMTIEGVRLTNCFFGEDGLADAFFDTHGGQHLISGGFYEIPGSRTTGRAFSVAKSSLGIGIQISANNEMMNICGAHISGCQRDGIISQAEFLQMTGCTIINNGIARIGGRRNGIYHFGGVLNVTGGIIKNLDGDTDQEYGITSIDAANLTVTGVYLRGNSTAAINAANRNLAVVIACRGADYA